MGNQGVTAGERNSRCSRWRFGDAEFDESRWELRVGGATVSIERKPLEILLCLLRHAGEVVTKDELLADVWADRHVVEASVSNAVGKLRRALGDSDETVIRTVHGFGYQLVVPVDRVRAALDPVLPQLAVGQSVPMRPQWRLQRHLGSGRHGEVWLAAHEKTGEQRVFKFCLDAAQLGALKREVTIARLLRQTLGGRRDLPQLHEWNFHSAPYFIECEYFGADLPSWSQARGGLAALPLALRIDLLAQAAEAVAAIHSVGVLHKDLKPQNLLIREQDGVPVLRLTDFGSGALADHADLQELGITKLGFTAAAGEGGGGTPLYLAPEVLAGQSPTAQADIYALGVLLYQLAIGDLGRPLAAGWEHEIGDELLRDDIRAAADGAPERRLASAADLADRLGHRERRAMELRREQAQRRAQARRPLVISAMVLLAAALSVSLYFARQAAAARDEALSQQRIAQTLNDFLYQDLLSAASPSTGGGASVTVFEAVDRAAAGVSERFRADPQLEVRVHQTFGRIYGELSQYSKAESHLRRALELSSDPAMKLELRVSLARVAVMQQRVDEASQTLAKITELQDAERRFTAQTEYLLRDTQLRLAHLRGRWDQAVAIGEALLADAALSQQVDPRTVDATRAVMVTAYLHSGAHERSLALAQALHRDTVRRYGPDDARSIRTEAAQVQPLIAARRYAEAEALARRAIAQFSAMLGPTHHETLTLTHALGYLLALQDRRAEAEPYLQIAYRGFRDTLGRHHIFTLAALSDLGDVLAGAGRAASIVEPLEQAVSTSAQPLMQGHGLSFRLAYNLAQAYLSLSRLEEAERVIEGALRTSAEQLGAPYAAGYLALIRGKLAAAQGRASDALALLEEASRDAAADDELTRQAGEAIAAFSRN